MPSKTTHPSKEKVRDYMNRRTHEVEPPPTPEEIRRELGFTILEAERREQQKKERNE